MANIKNAVKLGVFTLAIMNVTAVVSLRGLPAEAVYGMSSAFYYLFAAICLTISLAMITSVLNMLARDTRKLILACMRLLLYLTPILWPISRLHKYGWQMTVRYIMKANPIYYVVCGYRDCFLYHHGILFYWKQMLFFWVFVIVIFTIGSMMMYKFKHKFIDMI